MADALKLDRLCATERPRGADDPSVLVVAVIAPEDLDAVLDVLDRGDAGGYHVTEAQARRCAGAATETYKGAVYRLRLASRLRLEVAVPIARAAELMQALVGAATHAPLGDGDIFAVDLVLHGSRAGAS